MTLSRIAAVALLVFGVAGCGGLELRQPLPEVKRPLAITVSEEPPSAMTELPTGVYKVADSTLYISGHQRDQSFPGPLPMTGGLLGVVIQGAMDQEAARKRVQEAEAKLHTQLIDGTRRLLEEKLKRSYGPNPVVAGKAGAGATLEISPYVVLTFVTDNYLRPFVILRTRLLDASGHQIWWTRYIVSVNEDRPITGEDGWATDDGKLLRAAVRRGIETGLEVLLMDASGALLRGKGQTMRVSARYAFIRREQALPGEVLEMTPERIVFIPDISDASVFAGVNIFDRQSVRLSDVPK